ncbi:MAG: DUF5681 domain-containing protein [Brevinema sp.]
MSKKKKEEIAEEKIGFKNPPKESQFQKGKSGNPKGRPKGSKNLKTILLKELESQISIQEKGRVTKVTKQEAFIKGLIANALKNDKHASQILVRLMTGLLTDQEEQITLELHEEDMEILKRYISNE